jgi:hypothetical protein
MRHKVHIVGGSERHVMIINIIILIVVVCIAWVVRTVINASSPRRS